MDDRIKLTIENLRALDFVGKSSHENLSNICKTFYPDVDRIGIGWTRDACEKLREILIDWLSEYDPADWADSYLAEQGLMRLPVDADGVPIHVGDKMLDFGRTHVVTVASVQPNGYTYISDSGNYVTTLIPETSVHYHKPTVKEVLRMFLAKSEDAMRKGYDEVVDAICAEYAEKLREVMADE